MTDTILTWPSAIGNSPRSSSGTVRAIPGASDPGMLEEFIAVTAVSVYH